DDGVLVPFAVDLRKRAQLEYFLDVANSIPASCVVHRRSCFDRYGYWPEDVPSAADWELWKAVVRPSLGANLAYAPEATALHFRASWRGTSQWGPAPLHRWLEVAADDRVWPQALREPVPAGDLPQAAIWRMMQADPQAWTRDLRTGISDACDLLAWTGSRVLDRLDASLEQARAESGAWQQRAEASAADSVASAHALELARSEIAAAHAEIGAAHAEIDALMSSDSWRVTAPVRWAGAALRRLYRR
ncbi:MAG TPA: hypothetical protein VFF55_03845, partial [Candidatus Deferrimicrobium sp.]|nr:hypothetical protein [Candidatus Deferrimicrobium sp.]